MKSMSIEVKKQGRETSQSLLRRFSRRIRQSGILLRVRRTRYREKPQNSYSKKKAALRREELRKKYEELEKLGKLDRYKKTYSKR